MRKIAYLAVDVHANQSVLGDMDDNGRFRGTQSFATSEKNIIGAIEAVRARDKYLVVEEGTLAYWAAQVVRPYVTEVTVCDPGQNWLICRSSNKGDKVDTRSLCRLLRLGELKRVYQCETDQRAIFKAAVQHYIDLRDQQVALKLKIKATYRRWGVIDVGGEQVYGVRGRNKYLKNLKHMAVQNQLRRLYAVLDQTEAMQKLALREMKRLGRNYAEIGEFKKVPGIGDIGAHIFDAFIQTPHRFANKRLLWRYSRLGITDRSSDGKPLGYKRLDRSGVSELKALSYRAWMSAMKGDNEVKQFYLNSLRRTYSRVHARLNTQRKILAVMYGMWKKGEAYRAEHFLRSVDKVALYD
jgi:transposase